MIFFKRAGGLDSETMRDVAEHAKVSWDSHNIVYRGKGIGYANGESDDEGAIQDAAESLLGYRPQPYDPPSDDTDGHSNG